MNVDGRCGSERTLYFKTFVVDDTYALPPGGTPYTYLCDTLCTLTVSQLGHAQSHTFNVSHFVCIQSRDGSHFLLSRSRDDDASYIFASLLWRNLARCY